MNKALFLFSAILAVTGASAASLVVGLPGNNQNTFPFGGGFGTAASTRYQQAYAASDFSTIGGPILNASLDLLNGRGNLASSTYSLHFSTIPAGIDTLSSVNVDWK